MLARFSTELQTREELDAKQADSMDCGITSPPSHALSPKFNIVCQQKPFKGWSAHVQILQRAYEGDNEAYHLAPGFYPTGLMISGGVTNYVPGAGNRQIYVEIDAAHSVDGRDAEQEHCRDILHAYAITLKAMQDALDSAKAKGPYFGDNREKAVRATKNAILTGLHPKLQGIVRSCVIDNWGVKIPEFEAKLRQLYLDTCNLTQQRDTNGWHTLKPDMNNPSGSLWSWTEYAAEHLMPSDLHALMLGEVKDIRKLMRGPQFSVNTTSSQQLIILVAP
ncbi:MULTISPECIES: hypothetical protein [Pseudomonas]|nr:MULTISPECIES: hypothetical protein [Pseudomonas]